MWHIVCNVCYGAYWAAMLVGFAATSASCALITAYLLLIEQMGVLRVSPAIAPMMPTDRCICATNGAYWQHVLQLICA